MAYRSKAEIEYYSGNFDQMLKDGEKALELAPNDVQIIGGIAYITGLSGWGCHSSEELKKNTILMTKLVTDLKEDMS